MRAVLDHLGVERCGVFGFSFTGAFGPWLAQQLPTRVAAVVAGPGDLRCDRGVTHHVVRGFDHEGLNAQLEVAWPEASAWLRHQIPWRRARHLLLPRRGTPKALFEVVEIPYAPGQPAAA